ncbi:MAG: hypothetical protein QM737_22550 [Ferruginibacter sp.]
MEKLKRIPLKKINLKEYYFMTVLHLDSTQSVFYGSGNLLIECLQGVFDYPFFISSRRLNDCPKTLQLFFKHIEDGVLGHHIEIFLPVNPKL